MRHHSRLVRTILPAPAGFSDENKFIFTVDAGGSVGLVDVAAGRCELTIPGGGGREERLVELMLDVTKGALALRYEGGRASDGVREVKCKNRVDVWDLAGSALDRSVHGDVANALVAALGPTCHRARASGHPTWSQPARAGDGVTKALRNRRPISGDWTQPGAPYLLVNSSALLLGGCGRGLAGDVDGEETARALRLVVAASHAWGRDADVDDAARRALGGEEGEGGGASESFDGFDGFADRTTDAVVGAGGAAAMAAIPVPETPEQQIAAAAAAAAAAMLQSRCDSFDASTLGSLGSTTTTPRASQSHSVASAGGVNDDSRITAMAWDENGERLAAFSDRVRRVHVWNVSAGSGKSLLPNLFARSIQGTASEVGYSHGVPCVMPSGGGDGTGLGESHGSRLDWKDGQTVTVWRGGVAASFRVGE